LRCCEGYRLVSKKQHDETSSTLSPTNVFNCPVHPLLPSSFLTFSTLPLNLEP
jgi:hypothetical protein